MRPSLRLVSWQLAAGSWQSAYEKLAAGSEQAAACRELEMSAHDAAFRDE